MAVDKSTGSLFTTQVIPFECQAAGEAGGDTRGSQMQATPGVGDKSVDVARQRRRVTARGDPFSDGSDRAGRASPAQRSAGSSCQTEDGAAPARRPFSRPVPGVSRAARLRNCCRTGIRLRLREAACCRERGGTGPLVPGQRRGRGSGGTQGRHPCRVAVGSFPDQRRQPKRGASAPGFPPSGGVSAAAPLAERAWAEACLSARAVRGGEGRAVLARGVTLPRP